MRRAFLLLSILSMSIFAAAAPAQPESASVSATVPAFARPVAPRQPIPLRWRITAAASAVLVSLAILAFAVRTWRTWNLFDLQYRFPRVANASLRLGATRSGGCMATIDFRGGSQRL